MHIRSGREDYRMPRDRIAAPASAIGADLSRRGADCNDIADRIAEYAGPTASTDAITPERVRQALADPPADDALSLAVRAFAGLFCDGYRG